METGEVYLPLHEEVYTDLSHWYRTCHSINSASLYAAYFLQISVNILTFTEKSVCLFRCFASVITFFFLCVYKLLYGYLRLAVVVSQKGNKYILITHAVNVSNMFEVLLSYIFTSTMNRKLAFVFRCFHTRHVFFWCKSQSSLLMGTNMKYKLLLGTNAVWGMLRFTSELSSMTFSYTSRTTVKRSLYLWSDPFVSMGFLLFLFCLSV